LFRYDRAFHDFDPIPLDNQKVMMEARETVGAGPNKDESEPAGSEGMPAN